MKSLVELTFKSGLNIVATVTGAVPFDMRRLTKKDALQIIKTEQLLEKLTGLRVHINQGEVIEEKDESRTAIPGD